MDTNVDVEQIERVLDQLARLGRHHDRDEVGALDKLRPAWLKADAWDAMLEDLAAQRYSGASPHRAHGHPRLQLVRN